MVCIVVLVIISRLFLVADSFHLLSPQRTIAFNPHTTVLEATKKRKKGTTTSRQTSKGFGKNTSRAVHEECLKQGFGEKFKETQPSINQSSSGVDSALRDAAEGVLGRAVAGSTDPFWSFVPALVSSKFPEASDTALQRVAGVLSHAVDPSSFPLELSIVEDEYRPHGDIHAYMPGLGPTVAFYNPSQLELCSQLEKHYDVITEEYEALLTYFSKDENNSRGFQSVTSMNYESGWKTLVLFYNGHRIPNFPYNLCPVTTRIMESVPLAGRIAGFNRQAPGTGIPLHSDGNNMWLTCQMGILVPEENAAWIRVGPETRHWSSGQCLVYDTTYEHETMNSSLDQERVVLHIDFFNTLAMTELEIKIMQYIYAMREKFMAAEGVSKVGAQIL